MSEGLDGKMIVILMVEDNPGDVLLTKEALKESKLCNEIHVARDGVEAMDFLLQKGQYADSPRPDLILLDLNLPKKNGREVLTEIKEDPDLKCIPVVILTTSDDDVGIDKTYELHANCYITKPIDLNQFMKVIKAIEEFWFTIVKLPSRCGEKRSR